MSKMQNFKLFMSLLFSMVGNMLAIALIVTVILGGVSLKINGLFPPESMVHDIDKFSLEIIDAQDEWLIEAEQWIREEINRRGID